MKSLFFIAILLATATPIFASPPGQEGKNIFTTRCASCHAVNKILTGPALAGVDERRSIDWIISFVHSSQTMVKAGDKTAVELFAKFNKIPMPDHPDLKEDDIKNIVAYIKSEASAGGEKAPFAKPVKLRPAYTPLTFANAEFFVSYFAVVVMLILALLFAVQIKQYERKNLGQE
ncbi:MAG TPA: cytochrome c [Chitinophagaceae bacterium]|nr:cytochrome c [Chitinophagaceae bacterium]